MKVLWIFAVLVGTAMCSLEPAGYRSSSTYLPPSFRRRTSSVSSNYLPPSSRRQSTYLAPQNSYYQQSNYQRSENTYQVPSYRPSQEYNKVSSRTYLPYSSSNTNTHQSLSVPSNRYIPSPPQDTFELPEVADVRNSNLPSASYGVPSYNSAHSRGHHRYSHEDDYSGEPAKYDFGYQVKDNYGNDYSHHESRSGTKTHGAYTVLLPDGRRQIVEYEADEAGYRPKITYENVQTDRAAYPGEGPY